MKSYKAIPFSQPVREVRLVSALSPGEHERRLREAERAAYERGRQDGERALGDQLVQQRTELLELHQGVVESLRAVVPQLVREAEKTLIELALEVARKLVAGIPIKPQLVEAVVREAISQVGDSSEIVVNLHPDDLALLRKHQSPILKGLPETGSLRFAGSGEVTRGGCTVVTRFGLLDARRETKMEQIRQSIAA
jgi:flagellar biosynthesis/type III secretory pathway protein FliH